jgi:hypothetical protein
MPERWGYGHAALHDRLLLEFVEHGVVHVVSVSKLG